MLDKANRESEGNVADLLGNLPPAPVVKTPEV